MTTTTPEPGTTTDSPQPQRIPTHGPATGLLLRRLALRVHFFAGLLVAPFLAVLCLTGIAYVFTPQLDDMVYHHEYFVDEQSGTPHPLAEQINAALAANPSGTLTSVTTPASPDRTTQVTLAAPGLADGLARTVYIDPYTAGVQGSLVTDSGRPPFQQWLRDLHGNLQLGTPGRLYSEVVASWLPILVGGGLILWIGRRRKRRMRDLLLPSGGTASGRTRLRNRHAALGLWLAIGLLAVSVTGLTWSNYAGDRFEAAITALDGHTPVLATITVPEPTPHAVVISPDQALAAARADGLSGSLALSPPSHPGAAFTITENFQTVPVRSDSVSVNPYTGAIIQHLRFADFPLLAKLTTLGILLHSGTLLGLVNQIAMALLALGTLVLILLGYRMWWRRRPGPARLASAPARSVWRGLPPAVLLVVVALTVAVGWALPVLGVSLIGFIVLDVALGTLRRRARPVR